MNSILIDTMHVADFLIDDSYFELVQAVEEKKIMGFVSVITLTELIKIRGVKNKEKMHNTLNQLLSSNLIFLDITRKIAITAGEIRLKYDIPTADSLIAASGIVENVKHILTDDEHFEATKSLIKPIDLKAAMRLV
jgi:predicted nucleic acid-binding protein